MFRFTIRELVLLTLIVGVSWGWWLEHHARIDVTEDACMLARFSALDDQLGQEKVCRLKLERKYGVERTDPVESTLANTSDE